MRTEYVFSEGLRIEDMERAMKDMHAIMIESNQSEKPVSIEAVNLANRWMADLGVSVNE